MNLIANIGLFLAVLMALPIAYVGMVAPPRHNSLDFTFVYLILMYWPCSMPGFGVAITRGEFDWLFGRPHGAKPDDVIGLHRDDSSQWRLFFLNCMNLAKL